MAYHIYLNWQNTDNPVCEIRSSEAALLRLFDHSIGPKSCVIALAGALPQNDDLLVMGLVALATNWALSDADLTKFATQFVARHMQKYPPINPGPANTAPAA